MPKPQENKTRKESETSAQEQSVRLVLIGTSGDSIFGRKTAERLQYQFSREGIRNVLHDPGQALSHFEGITIFVRADAVLDPPLIRALREHPGLVLLADNRDVPLAVVSPPGKEDAALSLLEAETAETARERARSEGFIVRRPGELGVNFWKALRKREAPYALILSPEKKGDVEWRVFMGTYKGATDFVTKRLWPVPAFYVTRWLAEKTPVTPNMVTTLSALLVIIAFFLFWNGHYASGLLAAWLMTFLDTVDGKLARTTLTSSHWGNIFDHGIDLVHPPFWYWAWAMGLDDYGLPLPQQTLYLALAVIIGGYVLQRIIEGVAIAWLGMEIHIWRPIDTFFREITARRNPNLVILTFFAFMQRPDLGLLAVAWWTGICLILHGIQIIQALIEKRRKGELVSWMAREAGNV